MAFKLDIPKKATIEKTVFTCTIAESATIPSYEIFFRRSSPTNTLEFLKTCEFKSVLKLANLYKVWDFFEQEVEAGVEISSTKIKSLVQNFIDHKDYTPGVYFQLVILNSLLQNKKQSNVETFKCINQNDNMKKRPRLYIEWSV